MEFKLIKKAIGMKDSSKIMLGMDLVSKNSWMAINTKVNGFKDWDMVTELNIQLSKKKHMKVILKMDIDQEKESFY